MVGPAVFPDAHVISEWLVLQCFQIRRLYQNVGCSVYPDSRVISEWVVLQYFQIRRLYRNGWVFSISRFTGHQNCPFPKDVIEKNRTLKMTSLINEVRRSKRYTEHFLIYDCIYIYIDLCIYVYIAIYIYIFLFYLEESVVKAVIVSSRSGLSFSRRTKRKRRATLRARAIRDASTS